MSNTVFSFKPLAVALMGLSMAMGATAHANTRIYQTTDSNGTPMLTNTSTAGRVVYTSTTPQQSNVQHHASTQAFNFARPNGASVVNYDANRLQFVNARSLGNLKSAWQQGGRVVVAHFGDSHVQNGWQGEHIRRVLQSVRGNGGRGMVFPYATAKTYSQEDYESSFTGTWRTANSIQQPPRIGVGVSGFVASTSDKSASITLNFKNHYPALGNVRATVYYRVLDGEYRINANNGNAVKSSEAGAMNGMQSVTFDFPSSQRTFALGINRISSGNGTFELHGISLQNMDNAGGLIYHNLGVGGAAFKALLQQKHFEETYAPLNANVTILDWGTNDILYENAIAPDFEATVRDSIRRVRAVNPNTAIILTSTQEANWRQRPTTVAATLATLIERIAREEGVMYYDWYTISGGRGAMAVWQSEGFASRDGIHLNGKGYRTRGELLAQAIIKAVQ